MATAKKTAAPTAAKKPAAEPSKSRAIANWDEELAKAAAAAVETEASTATGSFFSFKAGILSWNDSPLQNNEVGCIIVDGILENVYFGSEYDSDNPQPPLCFAFGRIDDDMSPHKAAVDNKTAVCETCSECEFNKFGSADKGRGKACRNIRRIALIPAGNFDKQGNFEPFDEDEISSATLGFAKLPVTSVKPYSAYVKQLDATLKRPPYGVFTKMKVVPDADTQFKVTFECLGKVPNDLMAAVVARHEEAKALIEQPYNMEREERPVRGPASRKTAAKPAGKRKF